MTRLRPVAWLRARTPVELAAGFAGVLVLGWLGWDLALWDPRQQLLLHLVAGGAVAGVAVAALRGGTLPRTPLEVPILLLLAAYAAATASALNHGVSLRAMAAVVAYAAMLPIVLLAIRHRSTWVGLLASIPVLALAVPTLGYLLARRLDWIVGGAPGLPPLRLLNEGTPFGSVAVPPFVIWPAWALAGLIEAPRWRRGVRAGLVVTGIPLTVLSGSRSAWLAIGATLLVAVAPWAWSQRHRLRRPTRLGIRETLVATGVLLAAALALLLVLPRLTAVASLLYRASLWRDTLTAWSSDPLLGVGPGFMPVARQVAAADYSFPVRQPHSHNLPLGVLGDAGIVGLGAGLLLVSVIVGVAGPWRMRTPTGRAASLALLGLAIGGLFEDLTFLPNFNLLAIALLAVALTDGGSVTWWRLQGWRPPLRLAAAVAVIVIAVALAPASLLGDAGAIAHARGVHAFEAGQPAEAQRRLERAAALDPWQAAAPKALAVAADAAGDPATAREAAERAVRLNPGDGASWANLAVLCGAAGDEACQARSAARAAATASFLGRELATAAVALEALGRTDAADDAYRRSLLSQRLTAFALDWPRQVTIGDGLLEEDFGVHSDLHRVLAWWAAGEPVAQDRVTDPAVRALAHAIRGEREEAARLLDEAIGARSDDPLTWQIAIVVRDHWGQPVGRELRAYRSLAAGPFPARDDRPVRPASTRDIATFRVHPGDELVRGAERLETDPIWPWVLAEALP
jgi:tetratricopeptide (TPR) repeat protein